MILDFRMVDVSSTEKLWEASRHFLLPAIERGRMSEEYIIRKIQEASYVLVHAFHDDALVGAFVYSIGELEGARSMRVHLLGGEFPDGWIPSLDYFLCCIANAAEAKTLDFYTTHKATHLTNRMGFFPIGTLYRKYLHGRA